LATVSISLVDGGLQEYTEDARFVARLKSLQQQGLEGRKLIESLISDDWAAPPRSVTVRDGDLEITIPYE